MMNELLTISGVRGYVDEKGTAFLNLEDVARGLGFTRIADSGNEVVRWERVDGYLRDLGMPTCGHDGFIPENIFYRLAMKAKNETAEKFQALVADEILPSIRRYGFYGTDETIDRFINDPDLAIKLLTKYKEEKLKRIEAEKTNTILMHVNKTYTATEIAKELGFQSAQAMNNYLRDKKIQYKQNDTWILYSRYATAGYVDIKQEVLDNGKVIYHRRFTQLGREWLLKLIDEKVS